MTTLHAQYMTHAVGVGEERASGLYKDYLRHETVEEVSGSGDPGFRSCHFY